MWTVTSAKPGNGVELLRDNSSDTFWQCVGWREGPQGGVAAHTPRGWVGKLGDAFTGGSAVVAATDLFGSRMVMP